MICLYAKYNCFRILTIFSKNGEFGKVPETMSQVIGSDFSMYSSNIKTLQLCYADIMWEFDLDNGWFCNNKSDTLTHLLLVLPTSTTHKGPDNNYGYDETIAVLPSQKRLSSKSKNPTLLYDRTMTDLPTCKLYPTSQMDNVNAVRLHIDHIVFHSRIHCSVISDIDFNSAMHKIAVTSHPFLKWYKAKGDLCIYVDKNIFLVNWKCCFNSFILLKFMNAQS